MSRKILFDACIGSRALNIHKPDSDYDIYQIYTETNPVELFYGNTSWNFSHRIEGNLDTIQSGVKRFMTSLTNGCAQSWEVFVTNKNQINKIDPSFEIFYEIPHTKMVPQLPLVNSVLKKFLIDRSKLTEKPKYNYETIKQGAFVLIALRHGKFLNIIDHVEKYDEIFDAPFLTYLHQIHDGTIKSQDFNHIFEYLLAELTKYSNDSCNPCVTDFRTYSISRFNKNKMHELVSEIIIKHLEKQEI